MTSRTTCIPTVQGVQVCITLFLLVMAALMIPCGKLTDRWARKRCFTIGLVVYGIGADGRH
jgi:MFS family permease